MRARQPAHILCRAARRQAWQVTPERCHRPQERPPTPRQRYPIPDQRRPTLCAGGPGARPARRFADSCCAASHDLGTHGVCETSHHEGPCAFPQAARRAVPVAAQALSCESAAAAAPQTCRTLAASLPCCTLPRSCVCGGAATMHARVDASSGRCSLRSPVRIAVYPHRLPFLLFLLLSHTSLPPAVARAAAGAVCWAKLGAYAPLRGRKKTRGAGTPTDYRRAARPRSPRAPRARMRAARSPSLLPGRDRHSSTS